MVSVRLPRLPRGKQFEEVVSAYLQCSGLYLERNIIERGEEEVLELDIVAGDYNRTPPLVTLWEVKSGNWGFPEIFKIKGWMVYLSMQTGFLVAQKGKHHMDFIKDKSKELGIRLLIIQNISQAKNELSAIVQTHDIHGADLSTWRFSYWLERNLLRSLNDRKKEDRVKECFRAMTEYYFEINSNIFFTKNAVDRVVLLYDIFQKYPLISAKCAHELEGDEFGKHYSSLPKKTFEDAFYKCVFHPVHISTYIEHRARLAILKNAIECAMRGNGPQDASTHDNMGDGLKIRFQQLPNSFMDGLRCLAKHKYYHRYPIFWQWFMWFFGGFILTDYKDQEYQLLSEKTGIPVSEIDNALNSYELLFPLPGGWLTKTSNSEITYMKLFPVPFMGVGANYRRILYADAGEYTKMKLTGLHTRDDLIKWNNLLIRVLDKYSL